MTGENKYYEITYLARPSLTDEELLKVETAIRAFIQEKNGIVESSDRPQKKYLAFPIQDLREVHANSLRFTIDPATIKQLDNTVKDQKEILRFMITKGHRLQTRKILASRSTYTPKKETAEKTNIETIDKKLDEILKE